jgi:hypothetical protein
MASTEEPPLAGDSDSVEQLLVAVNDNDPTAERPSEATHLYVSLLSRTEIEKLLAARERYEADCPNLYKAIDIRLEREKLP